MKDWGIINSGREKDGEEMWPKDKGYDKNDDGGTNDLRLEKKFILNFLTSMD